MRLLIIIFIAAGAIVLCIFVLVRALVVVIPYYVAIGAAAYFIWRADRREKMERESFEREARRERELRTKEYRAWRVLADHDRKSDN